MAQKYWINNSFIDLSRNQITQQGLTVTMQPKALAVLTYLAEHQGSVVTQDAIMTHVWQETIVSPNSLQRCIAQLRKALGDNGKNQSLIKTHAKQGYSLETAVKWQLTEPLTNKVARTQDITTKLALPSSKLAALFVGILLLSILGLSYFSTGTSELAFNKLTPLTTSDEKEGGASYSPDGRYIVFHRYDGLCESNLWAIDLKSQQEIQLTQSAAWYSSLSFSPDGKQLIFLAKNGCKQVNNTAKSQTVECRDLVTLHFGEALNTPQQPKIIKQCQELEFNMPYWLNDESIAMLQNIDDAWKIMRHTTHNNQVSELYAPKDRAIYNLSYSASHNLIAAISTNDLDQHLLDILDNEGALLASHIINRPAGMSPFLYINPTFSPMEEQLVFTTKKQLFSLSFNGDITEIKVPLYENIYGVRFHPNGTKLVATYGTLDTDIARIHFNEIANEQSELDFNQVFQPYPSISRSTSKDQDAKFQPDGDLITFISERSGTKQLWITDDKHPQQLTQFPLGTTIDGIGWSSDSESIFTAVNGKLYRVSLVGKVELIPLDVMVKQLYQSDFSNTLLLLAGGSSKNKLMTYNTLNGELTLSAETDAQWAAMNENGVMVYLDENHDYWRIESKQTIKINNLNHNQKNYRMVMTKKALLGINDNHQLWSYNLQTGNYKMIQQLNKYAGYLSDVQQEQLLLTQIISAKKEIVELSKVD
ncbi:MAG: winged helix-turn-helix domain-containing protein [Colwellia sp.]|nr:winged helix-turn-helix domain-containing protein [Colwellia sp.]